MPCDSQLFHVSKTLGSTPDTHTHTHVHMHTHTHTCTHTPLAPLHDALISVFLLDAKPTCVPDTLPKKDTQQKWGCFQLVLVLRTPGVGRVSRAAPGPLQMVCCLLEAHTVS